MINSISWPGDSAAWMSSNRTCRWLAVGIICLGLGLRLLGLSKGVWLDEAHSLDLLFNQNFLSQLKFYDQPPLYFALLKLWSQVASSEPFLRLLSIFFGLGTVVVIMEWIKPYSRLGSLLAGLYCATLPMMLRYSQELRGYGLLLFAMALSFYFASRLMSEPDSWVGYAGLGFSLAVAISTHAVGILFLISICAFMTITPSSWRRIRLKRVILALAVPLGLFILLFVFFPQVKRDPDSWWVPATSGEYLLYTTKQLFGLDQARWPFWVISNTFPVLANKIVALLSRELDIIILAGPVLIALAFGNWRRSLPFLVAAVLYWGQMLVYSVVVLPILIDRTALPGMLPFMGFIGVQIATTRVRKLKIALAIGLTLLCLVFAVNWTKHEAWTPIEPWSQIVALLESTRQPGDIVILYPDFVELPLRYYVELPPASLLLVSSDPKVSNLNVIESTIRELAGGKNQVDSSDVFLIYRDDLQRQRLERHEQLLTLLKSQFGEPCFSTKLGWLTLSKYKHSFPRE